MKIIAAPENMTLVGMTISVDQSQSLSSAASFASSTFIDDEAYKSWDGIKEMSPVTDGGYASGKILLVNFDKWLSSRQALQWAKEYRLRPVTLRTALGIGDKYPNLDKTLKVSPLAVVTLAAAYFKGVGFVVGIEWVGSSRGAKLYDVNDIYGPNCWFAFCRDQDKEGRREWREPVWHTTMCLVPQLYPC
ncbi:MAG: hypothetical protein Q8O87_04030 [bacterium]|nr:hypothetical protein [bacterium]